MISNHIHQPKQSNNHTYSSNQRNLLIALLITAIVMIAEIIGGLLANSLALLSDAGHMLTDILALGLSLVAMRFAQKPPTPSKTFGFHRLEILDELRKIKGVKDVHHLHLWTITSGINAMSAHVLIDDLLISSSAYILKEIKSLLHNNYRIGHSTIQFESKSCGDGLLQNHVHR